MRILVKIGGAQLEEPGQRAVLCGALRSARDDGHELIVVHGGGNQIRTACKSMGLPDRYHDGLRITDAKTAEVVLMVLGGLVNRTLVAALQRAGVPAVGICGADGGSFAADKLTVPGADLGFVGSIASVQPALVDSLLGSGHVPVIATVAPRAGSTAGEPFLNLNADHAAGPLCRALGCDALLFLTDVPGVLDAHGALLADLTPADCERLARDGVAKGGMLPKLDAAVRAVRDNPGARIVIAPGAGPDAVRAALCSGTAAGTGTRFHPDGAPAARVHDHG